jgi:hypothetical protein
MACATLVVGEELEEKWAGESAQFCSAIRNDVHTPPNLALFLIATVTCRQI